MSVIFGHSGVDIINVALATAMNTKEKDDWTPVTVNVASATLTILHAEVRVHTQTHTHSRVTRCPTLNKNILVKNGRRHIPQMFLIQLDRHCIKVLGHLSVLVTCPTLSHTNLLLVPH